MKADLYNLKGETVGTIELPARVFETAWKPALVHQVLVAQEANAREPWAHAKGRGEVRGGGIKPWRQKGTGRARHGSRRSPLWAHGGVSHGPHKDRDYSQKINVKMKRIALFSALSKKLKDAELKVIDNLSMSSPKTKQFALAVRPALQMSPRAKAFNLLLIPEAGEKNIFRAARNIPKTKVVHPESLNVKDVLQYKNLFLDQRVIETIAKHFKI